MEDKRRTIFIGYDSKDAEAFLVARHSIARRLTQPIRIRGIYLEAMRHRGLYTRPTARIRMASGATRILDERSARPGYDGAISTEFAISRFLLPWLAEAGGMAMFCDSDFLGLGNVARLFELCEIDSSKALWCVKHDHRPTGVEKMDGQTQTQYARKNWSSMMVWNLDHPATAGLTLDMVNELPGRDLHRFCWLKDEEIGEVGSEWNHLVGWTKAESAPQLVHFTEGTPQMPGYERCDYADEWRDELRRILA